MAAAVAADAAVMVAAGAAAVVAAVMAVDAATAATATNSRQARTIVLTASLAAWRTPTFDGKPQATFLRPANGTAIARSRFFSG